MVTETETLTSTLHLNKFTYLDYVFLLSSYCRILIHTFFHTVLSEKQMHLKHQDGNCTRMLRSVLNKSWKQLPPKTAG